MLSRSYLFLLVVLVLAVLSLVLYMQFPYHYGIDVRGGVRLIEQMELKPEDKARLDEIKDKEEQILENRVHGNLGQAEGTVQAKGDNQFIIELPGYADIATARAKIGTTASLEWYWAKTVQTDKNPLRPYKELETSNAGKPEVTFHDQLTEKDIKPGEPAYDKMIDGWELLLKGDELKKANVATGPRGGFIPEMLFNPKGAAAMEKWSRRNTHTGEKLAAVLDKVVLSIAPLKDGAIISDEGIIDGTYDPQYVQDLVQLLNSGALPVKLDEISAEKVDPTIGQYALGQIVSAGGIAFGVICAFMMIYYMFPGVVAVLALCLYTLFTLSVLKSFGATFSLAGIAGFVLSVGMAVDANILVFERVKEELRGGRPLDKAIDIGFRRALSAIIDSNACTLITSFVLVYYGTGPVKGFATTLIIGVAISLFTAVTVTRSLLVFFVGSGLCNDAKWFGLNRQWFGKFELNANSKPLQIVNKCARYFWISGLTIVPGLIFVSMGGIKPNVEFQGGYQVEFKLDAAHPVTSNELEARLEKAGMKGSNVQFAAGKNGERIAEVTVPRTKTLAALGKEAEDRIAEAAGFPKDSDRPFSEVGETIRAETVINAIKGVIFASAFIVIYLAIRFGVAVGGFVTGLRFSMSAIGALIHDILVVIGVAAIVGYLAGWEISSLFITAMLTMIGFSTHDTIVIFDRIRENLRRPHPNEDFGNLVNRSITQSFARSLNTSGTVIVTLLILLVLGSATTDLKFFSVAMLVGIISGTYSSIYNASPILYLWDKSVGKRKGAASTLMAISEKEILHTKTTVSTTVALPTDSPEDQKAKGYGQVRRRRASAVQRSQKNVDDDL